MPVIQLPVNVMEFSELGLNKSFVFPSELNDPERPSQVYVKIRQGSYVQLDQTIIIEVRDVPPDTNVVPVQVV